jgi:hypothetical protein
MQFALMIYNSPEEFDMRKNDYNHPHLGAWRAYYKALVEAGVYVGANALEVLSFCLCHFFGSGATHVAGCEWL